MTGRADTVRRGQKTNPGSARRCSGRVTTPMPDRWRWRSVPRDEPSRRGPDSPFSVRQAIVEKFAALLEANKTELTAIIAAETGKPQWEAVTEISAMINKIAISLKAYHSRTGESRRLWRRLGDAASSPAWRAGGVWSIQFSRPFAQWAYCAGAAGGEYAGV